MNPDAAFWQGKRVLVTGHTGFKGSWLALWLARLGARVTGLALAPHTEPALFSLAGVARDIDSRLVDMRDAAAVQRVVDDCRPELVLHLAAQALVRTGYAEPLQTWATNVMGTAYLLDALRGSDSVRCVLVITTDKVYRNHEWAYPYREDDALGGHDPYSASKAATELLCASYRDAFLAARGVGLATARAGNVIGGGDWSQDRLLPDAVRAWQAGRVLEVRRPAAIRPWQHVLDPLSGYLRLAQRLWQDPKTVSGAYNFGPQTHEAACVADLVEMARHGYGTGQWQVVGNDAGPHEAGWLALEVAHARVALDVSPHWPLATAVHRTMQWYRAHAEGTDARALCEADIEAHAGAAP